MREGAKLAWRRNLMRDHIIRLIRQCECIVTELTERLPHYHQTKEVIRGREKTRSPLSIPGESMGNMAMREKHDASTKTDCGIVIGTKIGLADAGIHVLRWQGGDEQDRGGSAQRA